MLEKFTYCGCPLDIYIINTHTRAMCSIRFFIPCIVLALAGILAHAGVLYAANVSRHNQTASGLRGWVLEDENIRIELNPLLKDQVRAFYLGRGFSETLSERIAQSCVFQTVIKNVSAEGLNTQLDVDLSEWRIVGEQGEAVPLVSKEQWIERWAQAGASKSSMLAFRWATFPTRQYFKLTGDYGWGMILFSEQPTNGFNLLARWRVNEFDAEQLVTGLSCAD